MLDRREAQVRPSPSRGAGQRVGAVQSLGSMCLAARARAVRPRAAPPGRARGQGSAPIVPRCYCMRFAASAGPIRLSTRTSGRRDGAGGGPGGQRRTRHGRHKRDGRNGRRRRRGRHNQLQSLRGRSAPRIGQLYHRQTGLTAVATCRSMPLVPFQKDYFFSFRKNMDPLPSRVHSVSGWRYKLFDGLGSSLDALEL